MTYLFNHIARADSIAETFDKFIELRKSVYFGENSEFTLNFEFVTRYISCMKDCSKDYSLKKYVAIDSP